MLKLADGTLVYPDGRVVPPSGDEEVGATPRIVAVPTHREAQQLVVSTRRKLADLPDVPKTMNAVSVILSYTLFGLDDDEISVATGLSTMQVRNIRSGEAYSIMHGDIVRSIVAAETDDVRDMFMKHSRDAASTVINAMTNEKLRMDVRMKAATDVLDRAGFRPNDVVEHRHKMEGGLVIEVVKKDGREMPVIDMEVD